MLSLNDREWNEFKIGSIFTVSGTTTTPPANLVLGGQTPRITCSSTQNGLDDMYLNPPTENGGVITVDSATVGNIAYQYSDFIATDHVEKIAFEEKPIDRFTALFLITNINKAKSNKYDYGYKFSQTRIRKQTLMLPANLEGQPDYDFMEAFVKERERIKTERYTQYCKEQFSELGGFVDIESLSSKSWGSFFIKKIFDEIERGKRLKKDDHISGDKPYVSSTSLNNGVDRFIGNESKTRVFEDCLSLANSGSVGSCFYEPFQFVASDHVTHLKKYDTSIYIYLFMATMLNRLSEKYNFNREINDSRISREKILLPITEAGEPDYAYMEQYAKNIMLKKYKQYLDFLEAKEKARIEKR